MKKIYYILVFMFLVSCTSNTIYEKPKDLIPKDTMVNLLTDLFLANSATNVKNKNLESTANYYPIVFKRHNIDSLRFKNSNIYYLSKIDEYEKLFIRVKDTLKIIEKAAQKIEDSLRSIKKKIRAPKNVELKVKESIPLKNQKQLLLKKKR